MAGIATRWLYRLNVDTDIPDKVPHTIMNWNTRTESVAKIADGCIANYQLPRILNALLHVA